MGQHALSIERWSAFSFDQQILMIANEMHRAGKLGAAEDRVRLVNAYERTLYLTDLTIQLAPRPAARRELLRWRDIVAALYAEPAGHAVEHAAALRCLLRFTPRTSRQLGGEGVVA